MSAQQQVGIVGVFSDAACTTEVAPGYGSLNQVVTIGQCTTITLGGYPAGSGILTSNGASLLSKGYIDGTCSGTVASTFPTAATGVCSKSSDGLQYQLLAKVVTVKAVYAGVCGGSSLIPSSYTILAGAPSSNGICTSVTFGATSGSILVKELASGGFSAKGYMAPGCLAVAQAASWPIALADACTSDPSTSLFLSLGAAGWSPSAGSTDASTDKSREMAVGLGVGLGVGIPVASLIIFLYARFFVFPQVAKPADVTLRTEAAV